jgi:hypothetical protein
MKGRGEQEACMAHGTAYIRWVPAILCLSVGAAVRAPAEDSFGEKEETVRTSTPSARRHANRLARESSPYLLQHAHNPVDWYPWGEEAFGKARREEKPIFLSVGYSSCHWCHVMKRESFEDDEVARVLNAHFVAIKVDREERPDVDDLYMRYVQLTGQGGGWPMSVFLTPEGVPFFGGTYWPKARFLKLLDALSQSWRDERPRILAQCGAVREALQEHADAEYRAPERPLSPETSARAFERLCGQFDFEDGGLLAPQKFPPHQTLAWLLDRAAAAPEDPRPREMLKLTLDRMMRGGIHDHLGGGFHRYATDTRWFLPHFEKMLYDNAQLAEAYARASALLKDPACARTARGTYDWVLREMTAPDGAFYSSLDADSEGGEGRFYVWSYKEVEQVLGADAPLCAEVYGLKPEGNYDEEAAGRPTGWNIFHLPAPLEEVARRRKLDPAALQDRTASWKEKLLAARSRRPRPPLDDKVLTGWNALMIGSLARGSRWLNEPRYLEAALRAAEWLLARQRTPEGRWRAAYRAGQSKLAAYLDDYAFLAHAFLDLHEATGKARWRDEAVAVVQILDEHFRDAKRGGYFFVADDHERLLARVKSPLDHVTPSGNGSTAQALVRLARLTGEPRYAERARELFSAFHALLDLAPLQVESLLRALDAHFVAGGKTPGNSGTDRTSGLSPNSRLRVQRGPVVAELFVGHDRLCAGEAAPVVVRLTLDEGYHLQSSATGNSGTDQTSGLSPNFRFRLATPELGRLAGEKYPPPEKIALPRGGEIAGYRGTVVAGAWLNVPPDARPGAHVLKVEVEFQACGRKSCEAPQTVTLSCPVEVVAPGTPVTGLHREVFQTLGLQR